MNSQVPIKREDRNDSYKFKVIKRNKPILTTNEFIYKSINIWLRRTIYNQILYLILICDRSIISEENNST